MQIVARIDTPRGSVVKTKDGVARLIWNPDFQPNWQHRYTKAQMYVDNEVLRLSDPYIPFQSGMLKKSGILGTEIGSGTVVWNAPYARYLYYGKAMGGVAPKHVLNKNLTYHGAPQRGAFWFERMKADKGKQILRGAARLAGGSE
jgi:hypothetical protein